MSKFIAMHMYKQQGVVFYTFELFCSMGTGNLGLGMLVSHSLKSLWTFSPSICSTSLSRDGIHEGERWQFWKKTQRPLSMAS